MAMRNDSPHRSSQRATKARESTASDIKVMINILQKLKTVLGIVNKLVSKVPKLTQCVQTCIDKCSNKNYIPKVAKRQSEVGARRTNRHIESKTTEKRV